MARVRIGVALAATALAVGVAGGCAVPESITGHPRTQSTPTVHGDSTDPAKPSTGDALPSDAGSLASMAQQLASQNGAAATDTGDGSGDTSLLPGTGPSKVGGDISWPQCPAGMGIPQKRSTGQPLPLPNAAFVVVGLTNGPGFVRNPCLSSQVEWVKAHQLPVSAYSVISYPTAADLKKHGAEGPYDATTTTGKLQNVGYAQATYNIGSMGISGLESPIVWLDVEPVSDFDWSSNTAANAAVVQGAARGYKDAGYEIGVYSTPSMWQKIVGTLSLGSDVAEWRPAGSKGQSEALARCSTSWSIQGGRGILGQWVQDRRDRNLVCPGVGSDLSNWFHQT